MQHSLVDLPPAAFESREIGIRYLFQHCSGWATFPSLTDTPAVEFTTNNLLNFEHVAVDSVPFVDGSSSGIIKLESVILLNVFQGY